MIEFWPMLATLWLFIGILESCNVICHARLYEYKLTFKMWLAAIFWFLAALFGYFMGFQSNL